jgi:hypothetical protein
MPIMLRMWQRQAFTLRRDGIAVALVFTGSDA